MDPAACQSVSSTLAWLDFVRLFMEGVGWLSVCVTGLLTTWGLLITARDYIREKIEEAKDRSKRLDGLVKDHLRDS